jgi:DNA polymerase-3 subunit beta
MPPEDFPAMPAASRIPFVKVKPPVVLEMIEKTFFAVSQDETRFNLNGVFFDAREGSTRMVATDGHRLSVVERRLEGDFKLKRGVIVPRKGLQELRRLLGEGDDAEAELGFAESSGVFRKTGLTMIMRLIDGQFPDYQQVVPKQSERVVKLGRVRFLDALRRVSLLSQDQMHTVKLEVGGGVVRITSQSPDLGEAQEEIPVETDAAPIAVGFNARYLMDVLQVIEAADVAFELNDDMSPGVLRPEGDPSYTAVVMPVRI